MSFSVDLSLAACRTRSSPGDTLARFSVSGACQPGPRSPWPLPLAPSAPLAVVRPRSPTSQLLWQGPTSPARASSASALRPSRCGPAILGSVVGWEISRFPRKERPCMPGSLTTRGRPGTRVGAPDRVAFRRPQRRRRPDVGTVAAQWPACTLPCQRFDARLAAYPA